MGIQTSGQGTGAGSGPVRCSDCGGLNPAGAEWCGQCLRSFAPPPPPPPPAPVALFEPRQSERAIDDHFSGTADPPADAGDHQPLGADPLELDPLGIGDIDDDSLHDEPLWGLPPHAVDPSAITHAADSRRPSAAPSTQHIAPVVPLVPQARTPASHPTEPPVSWTCRLCETPNHLTANTCEVCGATFADTMRPPGPKITGDPNQAALYSLFWPGAGHAYLGQWGQALARSIMSAWVLVVTAFLLFGASGGGSKVFAVVFGLVATALWLAGAHDAFREASGQQSLVILHGRRYLYVTGTLMGLLFLMLLAGAATAAS